MTGDVPGETDVSSADSHGQASVITPPIGGHSTMDRHEAGEFAGAVESAVVLPVHYDTFAAIEPDAEAVTEGVEVR